MKTLEKMIILCGLALSLQAQIADFTPQTPLIGALLHGGTVEAKRLIEQGADPNQGRFVGFSPVFLAVMRQDVDLVRLMAAKGVDLNARDRSGSTLLMWAAFSEAGDAAVIEELLKAGADPHIANKAGETALNWALRRGETAAVAALRKAGASDTDAIRTSVEKALSLLQKSGSQFLRTSGCFSCHHQSLPHMALGVARTRGLTVDEPAVRQEVDATIALLKTVAEEALKNRDRIPDPPIGLSYTLLALAADNYPADETTSAMAQVIAAWQSDDGAFHTLPPIRPPIESSDLTATALSLRALQLYGKEPDTRVGRARAWLRAAKPRTTEEHAMQLLGLSWAHAPETDVRAVADALIEGQRKDGGWAQLPGLETDAYATGQALVALQSAGHSVASPEYRRGIAFLLRTQFADGSWLVRTRTFPVQPPKDSGFPHGKHQWISAAGTSWGAMALCLTLPAPASSGGRN